MRWLNNKKKSLLLLPLIFLAGCQWLSGYQSPPFFLPVLSPDSFGQSLTALQKISGERAGKQYVMLFQLEIDPQRLVLVGSTATGNSLFSVDYQQGVLKSNVSPLLPAQLDPRYVLADFQLAFWPATAIKKQLSDSDYQLIDQPRRRELWRGEQLLVVIDYSELDRWQAVVYFDNKRWGYRYRIETLDRQQSSLTAQQEKL